MFHRNGSGASSTPARFLRIARLLTRSIAVHRLSGLITSVRRMTFLLCELHSTVA